MSLHAIEEITNQTGAVLQSDGKLHVANYVWDTTGLTWARATQAGGGGGGAGDASAANQVAQIALETTIRDDTALIAGTVVSNELTVNPQAAATAFWPGYKGISDISRDGLSYDPGGALVTRGAVTTDEGTFRVNFANTSLSVSLGTVTVSGNTITGSGFLAADVNYHDYFKLDADAASGAYRLTTDDKQIK
jgi:hypothetical protein